MTRLREWYEQEFMRFTARRVVLTIVFVVLISLGTNPLAHRFYASDDMPPAFRNMDMATALPNIRDYAAAQQLGPGSLLVVGDCVGYGNGSAKAFTHYLQVPGLRNVNVSMHSFNYNLMLLTIDEAVASGVRDVVVQIHPFSYYRRDADRLRIVLEDRYGKGTTVADLSADDLVAVAAREWRDTAVEMESTQAQFSFDRSIDRTRLLQFSQWLREDVASRVGLYRNRYALDALGLQVSFFSTMTNRADTFIDPMPMAQQEEIFTSARMEFLWKQFVIADRDTFAQEMMDYSPQARFARYAQLKGIRLVFVMVPSMHKKIEELTVIGPDDLTFASAAFAAIARRYGAGYLDYLTDDELATVMYHYDNLTAAGQRVFGERLTRDLPPLLAAGRAGQPAAE
jgi:hypothetical protein